MTEIVESTEIVTREEPRGVTKTSLFDLEPRAQIAKATEMANALTDVIEKQKLYTTIQGKKYVTCEGWQLLGAFLGILPRESGVTELDGGSSGFEARIELVCAANGRVVGGASALCSTSEKRWSTAEKYAVRSMAITRATGKAYRLAFSWIIRLAGYEATPAEEMPTDAGQGEDQNGTARTIKPRSGGHDKSKLYTGEKSQQEAVAEILKTKKIPEDRWAEIHARLTNRPGKDLNKVIEEVTHVPS